MAKQFEYLIYRVGSNAANQSMTTGPVPIAIVRATNCAAAAETTWGGEKPSIRGCPTLAADVVASAGDLNVWANQHVYAVPRSRASRRDWNSVLAARVREDDFGE